MFSTIDNGKGIGGVTPPADTAVTVAPAVTPAKASTNSAPAAVETKATKEKSAQNKQMDDALDTMFFCESTSSLLTTIFNLQVPFNQSNRLAQGTAAGGLGGAILGGMISAGSSPMRGMPASSGSWTSLFLGTASSFANAAAICALASYLKTQGYSDKEATAYATLFVEGSEALAYLGTRFVKPINTGLLNATRSCFRFFTKDLCTPSTVDADDNAFHKLPDELTGEKTAPDIIVKGGYR